MDSTNVFSYLDAIVTVLKENFKYILMNFIAVKEVA